MELTLEQKAAVGRWVEDGARLADVQRRIHDEFGVQMTYMEVRLLVLDIGATPKDKPEPAEPAEPAPPAPDGAEGQDGAEAPLTPESPDAPPAGGSVTVELDKVVRAGAAMSGSVTFSDGVTGSWVLDAYGRLGITKVSRPGYQPTEADISAFQMELQKKLSGY